MSERRRNALDTRAAITITGQGLQARPGLGEVTEPRQGFRPERQDQIREIIIGAHEPIGSNLPPVRGDASFVQIRERTRPRVVRRGIQRNCNTGRIDTLTSAGCRRFRGFPFHVPPRDNEASL